MCDDLLAKEKEFRLVNKELVKRTEDLLKNIDSNEKKYSPESYNLNPLPSFDLKVKCDPANDESLVTFETLEPIRNNFKCPDDLLDDEFLLKKDSMIKFLKMKVKMLVDNLENSKEELKKVNNHTKDLEMQQKKANDCKEKLQNQLISLKEVIGKLERNAVNLQANVNKHQTENNLLKKEIESTKKELKKLNQQLNNTDIRMNRLLEENDKLKNIIKLNKDEEKDLKIQLQRFQDNDRLKIKNLEKENLELINAFKKQSILINNLKKQKAYLEASKNIKLTREEFLKIIS